MKLEILAHSQFTPTSISINGKVIHANDDKSDFIGFAKSIYHKIGTEYPKFFKMDELCKLAFLTTEVLLSYHPLNSDKDGSDIAVIFVNKDASTTTDMKHVKTLSDKETYFPSPAVFVYTLPNIMLGEICIRHQITGENTCFIMQDLKSDFIYEYVKNLFEKEDYKYCVTGWVNYIQEGYYAELFLISKGSVTGTGIKEFKNDFNKI